MIRIPSATPTSKPATNCHMPWSLRYPVEHRRQPLDVFRVHVPEPQSDVVGGRRTGVELHDPHDLGPATDHRSSRKDDLQLEPGAGPEPLVRKHADAAKTDVLRRAAVVKYLEAGRPAKDLCLDARILAAVGGGAATVSRVTNARSPRARPLYMCARSPGTASAAAAVGDDSAVPG